MKIKKQKKMNNDDMVIYDKPSLIKKIWFWLTCWRPITKYEFYQLKGNLIIILEGMKESDIQHYTTERQIIEEIKKIVETDIKKIKDNKDDNYHMYD